MPTQKLKVKQYLAQDQYLNYLDEGFGPVLLLIHGSLCDLRYWRWQFNALKQNYRIIIPSLRFYWPNPSASTSSFSISQHAHDLNLLIQHLNLKHVHVLGHSRGASVALELTKQAPQKVKSIILADPSLNNTFSYSKQQAIEAIKMDNIDLGLKYFINSVSGDGTWQKMVSWFKEMARNNAHTLFAQIKEDTLNFQQVKNIHLHNQPITLIGGADSPSPFPETIKILNDLWPQAQTHFLSPASHGMNLSLPDAFNKLILNHLANC